jgi:hypothetical protein
MHCSPCILSRSKSDDDVDHRLRLRRDPERRSGPRGAAEVERGIHRFKQRSFYYNVNTLVDYGHDFASRARIGTRAQLNAIDSVYKFRMWPAIEIENGGWHFGYFGGTERIKQKVAALAPFLNEYKLFGDEQLEARYSQPQRPAPPQMRDARNILAGTERRSHAATVPAR